MTMYLLEIHNHFLVMKYVIKSFRDHALENRRCFVSDTLLAQSAQRKRKAQPVCADFVVRSDLTVLDRGFSRHSSWDDCPLCQFESPPLRSPQSSLLPDI